MGLRTFRRVVRAIVVGRPVALGSEEELHFAATAMDLILLFLVLKLLKFGDKFFLFSQI